MYLRVFGSVVIDVVYMAGVYKVFRVWKEEYAGVAFVINAVVSR